MNNIFQNNISQRVVFFFFASFLLLGLWIYPDYGMSWDEFIQRISGFISYKYITGEDDLLLRFHLTKYYGPVFEIFLIGLEKIFGFTDVRPVFLMRHLVTFFLFFSGVFCFYRLCRRAFDSWAVGLLGAVLLILSPRIFAHAFYNSKDIAFMAMFIISIYTMVLFLEKRWLRYLILHAFTCAIVTDIRIMGILVPLLTGFLFVLDMIVQPERSKFFWQKSVKLLSFSLLTIIFIIVFWPALWQNPVQNFIAAFQEMSKYPSHGYILYFGEFVSAQHLPWHYGPGWIAITTPIFYIVMFVVGFLSISWNFLRNIKTYYFKNRIMLIALFWFFVPILAIIVLKSVLYDAWRQIFFVYPGFLLIALAGIVSIFDFCQRYQKHVLARIWLGVIIFALGFVAFRMTIMHPYQNMYFNRLAGSNIEQNFERDYWGLSYRKGLEYILANDDSESIPIYVQNAPGEKNSYLLSKEDRKRLKYVKDPRYAKYFLSNFKGRSETFAGDAEEFYAVTVDGFKILGVYRFGG